MKQGDHVLTLEFIGEDPDHPVDKPRGWIRTGRYNANHSSFTINSREEKTTMERGVDIAYYQSNKEYAIRVQDKDKVKEPEFFPYHGTQTSFKGENFIRELLVDGEPIDLTKKSGKYFFKEAKLIQRVEHRLSSDDVIRMESTFIVTFKDGKVYNDIRFKWLQPSIITSGYVFQMPVKGEFVSSFTIGDREQINATVETPQSTVENKDASIYRCVSNSEKGKDYVYQFKLRESSEPIKRLWIQHRDESLQKLYPQYYSQTIKEKGDIDIFRGYYEIKKVTNANKVYEI